MKRRDFNKFMLHSLPAMMFIPRVEPADRGPIPANLNALLQQTLAQPFGQVNTDWDGSIQMEGLLRWSQNGFPQALRYVSQWLDYHIEHDNRMSDSEYLKTYTGPNSRVFRTGPLILSTYSGNLGVSFPCYLLHELENNAVARDICLDVAEMILHYMPRDGNSLVAHDDHQFLEFSIPDVAYFAVRAMAIGSLLSSGDLKKTYLKQAVIQCEQAIRVFINQEKKLAHTMFYTGKSLGETFWCRAQGWMMWAISGLLRHLDKNHPSYSGIQHAFNTLAEGLSQVTATSGALRVWVDDPSSPVEVTGTAMVVGSIAEGSAKGWLPNKYGSWIKSAWNFILENITREGRVINAYTGWAKTAEQRAIRIDERHRGFVPGIILVAADQILNIYRLK